MPARFEPARWRIIFALAAACLLAMAGIRAHAEELENVLTNAEQIRSLSAEDASRPLPVRLRGVVVTEAGPFGNRAVVIADDTAGIYVLGRTNTFVDVHRGELLEVEGVTDPGEFAPIVLVKKFRRAGTGVIPKPREVTFEQMIAGSLDGQLVQVSGVVRSWAPVTDPNEFGVWHMELAVGGGRLTVSSNHEHPPGVEQDAEVRVQGVCFYQFNNKRQVLSPLVLISRDVTVEIEKPAPADPFATPVRAVSTLLQFSPDTDYQHRVHARGVVTYQQPGVLLWLRDQASGLQVQTRQPEHLKAGDTIDVAGYLRYGAEVPVLEDAVFRRQHGGPAPAPVKLTTPDDAFNHEEDLVSIDALLTEVQPVLEGWSYTFQDKGTSFKAVLRRPSGEASAGAVPGSRMRVTGICTVISDDSRPVISGIWHPRAFQILLRSPEDLAVLTPPPLWTPSHIVLLFATLAGASLLVAALVMFSARRHAREQKMQRTMAEKEFGAILAERNRVAREIHDTLAQGLAATSVQLMLAKKNVNGASESLSHHLSAAQELVRESLAEARNSIWNMRSHVLESSDLAGALKEVLKQRCDGTGIETSVEVSGRSRRFAPIIENNLLRIGQEAIFNATKYANAKNIVVKLEFGEKDFRLVVRDDGGGFDTSKPQPVTGGFGLKAMRERAGELKGELKINSDSARGTEIIFSVPLSGD
ncbi:MAG TPA: sensor histidine kinase [Candidatus Polarisedimenticolia bacterium]|nr:sensor histidine kinase [Candidatus Polarisedimenticolia bacterium]